MPSTSCQPTRHSTCHLITAHTQSIKGRGTSTISQYCRHQTAVEANKQSGESNRAFLLLPYYTVHTLVMTDSFCFAKESNSARGLLCALTLHFRSYRTCHVPHVSRSVAATLVATTADNIRRSAPRWALGTCREANATASPGRFMPMILHECVQCVHLQMSLLPPTCAVAWCKISLRILLSSSAVWTHSE